MKINEDQWAPIEDTQSVWNDLLSKLEFLFIYHPEKSWQELN